MALRLMFASITSVHSSLAKRIPWPSLRFMWREYIPPVGKDGTLNQINILIPATSNISSILQVRRLRLKEVT